MDRRILVGVLGNHFKFPPGFLVYRLPNTLSVIGSPGREDLDFPAAFSRSLVAPYLGNITLEGSGKLLSNPVPNRSLTAPPFATHFGGAMSSQTTLGRGVCSFGRLCVAISGLKRIHTTSLRRGDHLTDHSFSRLTGHKRPPWPVACSIPTLELTGDSFGRSCARDNGSMAWPSRKPLSDHLADHYFSRLAVEPSPTAQSHGSSKPLSSRDSLL